MYLYLILAFVAGMLVMDVLWAWRTGTLRMVLNRIRGR